MKNTFLALLLAAICAAPSVAQTIKTLGYNTTNGQIVYSGTNTLTFTNAFDISTNAQSAVRTNLGLGATWLTNTNVTNFRTAIGLGATNDVEFNSVASTGSSISLVNGEFLGPWYFDEAPTFLDSVTTRTNLGLPLPALTNTSNVTTMRALSGSTNTNHPFSGSVSVVGTNNTNTLVFSNGILQEVQ